MLKNQTPIPPQQTRIGRIKYFILGIAAAFLLLCLLVAGVSFLSFRGYEVNTNANTPPPSPATSLPEFPWPPRSSAFTKIPSAYLVASDRSSSLKEAAARLENALAHGGYGQTGYYSVPGGFALVSRLEQFKPDGLPADEPYRWSQQVQIPRIFSLDYLTALIRGKVGRYRVIVFVISNQDFFAQAQGKRVNAERAANLAIEGANKLPDSLGNLQYTDQYWCAALIYEFEKRAIDEPAEFKENGTLLAEAHLQKILPYLEKQK